MSTPKNVITNTFLSLISDRDLVADLTDQEMTELLDYYINDSTYLRFKKCKTNLSNQEPYDYHTDEFIADGLNKTYVLTDYPTLPNEDAISLIVTVDGENVGYTFTESTKTFVLTNLPTVNSEGSIGYLFTGQFNEDLSEEEILILSYGMLLSWFSAKFYKHDNYKNKITPRDYTSFSSANLLDKLLEVKKETTRELRVLINSYTYNDFTGFN